MTWGAIVRSGVIVLVTLSVAAGAYPQPSRSQHRARRERSVDRGRELVDQERQIRRTRSVTRRVLRDRRASATMKQQATDLDALLERREQMLAGLKAAQRDFLASHGAEIEELEALRKRALVLRERLDSARNQLLTARAGEISELKHSSKQAAEIAEALRAGYFQERRERRRR